MTRIFGLLALLIALGKCACADNPPTSATPEGGSMVSVGYHAEVEVCVGNSTFHGRVIVTRDGCVQFEHSDEKTRLWASEVIRRASSPSRGWDSRTEPVRTLWCGLAGETAPAEIRTANASIKLTQHQPLPER